MTWGAVASVAVSAVAGNQQKKSAQKAADQQREAARLAAEGAEFNPYQVEGGAFGGASFGETPQLDAQGNPVLDKDGNPVMTQQANLNLSPEMQAIQDRFGSQAGQFANQGQTGIGGLAQQGALGFMQQGLQSDPYALAQSQFGRMQDMLAPSRGRSREALESRLLKQGRLGSSGGSLQEQALQDSFGTQDQQMMFNAMQQGQDIRNQNLQLGQQMGMFGQQQQDVGFNQAQARLSGMSAMDQALMQYANLGSNLGGRSSAAGAQAGAFGMQGATAGSAALLGASAGQTQGLNQIGSALGDYFNSPSYDPSQGSGSYDPSRTDEAFR